MQIFDLDTPALVVDFDKMERNIARMQNIADDAGVKLRPHTKTHKTPAIAQMQLRAGARGITVAKVGEAEVMEAANIIDILIAFPLQGATKIERLLKLNERANLRVSLDSFKVARDLSDAAAARQQRVKILVEVDPGYHRVGVLPNGPVRDLVREITKLPGIEFIGVMTHAGHAYAAKEIEEVAEIAEQEGNVVVESAEYLRGAGIEVQEVSVGSTPTAPFVARVPGVTEIRPGNYVFYDAMQVALHSCLPDDCALTVIGTVVAKHPDRIIFDTGAKALTSDKLPPHHGTGHGIVKGYEKNLVIERLSEEHATVKIADSSHLPEIGDKIEIIPNHACPTVNLFDKFYAARKGQVIGEYEIPGRGKTQ
jgi:D-serine deaminase-like pyridoxal phosphate-dependent protein